VETLINLFDQSNSIETQVYILKSNNLKKTVIIFLQHMQSWCLRS